MRRILLWGIFACMTVVFFTADAMAIPAFARKYQMSCTTCHAPFPRLKPFGEEFAARGFRMEDASQEPTRATIDTGDPMLKLIRDVPLAIRMEGYASYKENAVADNDVEWPWAFKILSGGPITDHISYYFYYLVERGEIVGLEDAWVQFNSIFKAPVDLQVGQFQVCDPLFKRELRLERFDYDILTVGVGTSSVNLTYDRGAIGTIHLPAKFDVLLGVVTGFGISPADEDGNFDNDGNKNVLARLVTTAGPVRLGLFTYYGNEEQNSANNETTYIGPDVIYTMNEKFQVSGEFLYREDDNPWFEVSGGGTVKTKGGFVEVQYLPSGEDGKYALTFLYNKVVSDEPLSNAETVSLTFNYLLARNFRLLLEGGRDLEAEATRVTGGLITAF